MSARPSPLTLWNYHGVDVPSLVGLTVPQATSALTALNLTLGTAGDEIDVTAEIEGGTIRAQSPAANTVVAPNTAVNYQLGKWVPYWAGVVTWGLRRIGHRLGMPTRTTAPSTTTTSPWARSPSTWRRSSAATRAA